MHLYQFAIVSISSFIATTINLVILCKEYRKRKSNQSNTFFNKWTKYSSFICIISGTVFTTVSIIKPLTISCKYSSPLRVVSLPTQAVFMGFNQISRLYHCFSQKQVLTTAKGYPQYLFVIMIMIGFGLIITSTVDSWFWIQHVCNDTDSVFNFKTTHSADMPSYLSLWNTTNALIYLLWDFITLFLYVIKVRAYRNNHRIMMILKKIVMLTVLYEIPVVWTQISGTMFSMNDDEENIEPFITFFILHWTSWQLASVVINISVFLMQSHNETEYKRFLNLLHKSKMYYICCGCREIFILNHDNPDRIINNVNETEMPQIVKVEMEDTDHLRFDRAKTVTMETHTKTENVMSQVIAK